MYLAKCRVLCFAQSHLLVMQLVQLALLLAYFEHFDLRAYFPQLVLNVLTLLHVLDPETQTDTI